MALSSRRSARRSITTAAIGLVTLAFLAPCGASKAAADPGETRPGCGTYCQSAGQYGGAGTPPPSPVTILSTGTVTVEPDGYVPVTLKCNAQVQCQGALLLSLSGWSNPQDRLSWITGRSDLVVNAGATQTIGVKVPAAAIAYVRSQGPTPLGVTADPNDMSRIGGYQNAIAGLTLAAPG
jgi:hypothetical protein